MGVVRRDPKGADDGGTVELTEGGGETMAQRRQSGRLAWTRGRGKRGGGDGVLGCMLVRKDERGKKRGAWR
jgi:hypothetical protein